jgi:hypothetical protein
MQINTFDIDGVIYMGKGLRGVRPDPDDIIITGRSIEEAKATLTMLYQQGIFNQVFFNPIKYNEKTRASSGLHKARTIEMLIESGYDIMFHFEDDPIQIETIKNYCKKVHVIAIDSPTEKENVRAEL